MTNRLGRRPIPPSLRAAPAYRRPRQPIPPPDPPRNRTAEIITISILVAALVLLGLGGMLWAVERNLVFGPTPTPTATRPPAGTPTPDFRATRVAEDFATQQAYQAALLGTPPATPTPTPPAPDEPLGAEPTPTQNTLLFPGLNLPAASPTPGEVPVELPAAESPLEMPAGYLESPLPDAATPTALPNNIVMPLIVGDSLLPTPTAQPVAVVPTTPAPLPVEPPTATFTPLPLPPTETPTPLPLPPTATFTPEVPPTPSTPTPTPPIYQVSSLRGVFGNEGTTRIGPSGIYSTTTRGAPYGQEVRLLGRNPSGEWVYFCCLRDSGNEPAWTRQVYAPPSGNSLEPNAPDNIVADDVRWLPVQPALPSLAPLPTPFPPGPEDFPMARYDRAATGRIPALPLQPFTVGWTAQAGLAFSSPPAVVGNSVLVASEDQHLYSFDRTNGSQRWRVNLNTTVRQAPFVYQGEIFVAGENKTLFAFEDHGNAAQPIWQQTLDPIFSAPVSSFNIYSDTLFIAVGSANSDAFHTLMMIDRDNGSIVRTYDMAGPRMRFPTLGDQLVYVANGTLDALDVFLNERIWNNPSVANITAGPVYSAPGVRDLAELYVVDGGNRIWCLDANNGTEIWNIANDEPATSLAVNATTLFVAGNGYLKAVSRRDNNILWRTAVAGQVLGGPLVDGSRVLVVSQSGTVQVFDAQNGAPLSGSPIAAAAAAGPAVSGAYIFVPGTDGQLYALQGLPPPSP